MVDRPPRSEGHLKYFPPETKRHVVAGAGHFMPRERPGAVVEALRGLLAT
jgi:pimeloyl-ACP methyl ester carboxylesterase